MDPASLATAAVGLLAAYMGRLGEKAAGEVAAAADDAVLDRVRRLYELVKRRVAGDGYASGALERMEAAPDSERRQAALEDTLAEITDADAGFADQLRALVEELRTAQGPVQISDAGVVSVGGQVTMHGKYVAGRDMTIGQPPERDG